MKKLTKSIVILAVVAIALGSFSTVFAQTETPGDPVGYGGGGISSRSKRGGQGTGSTWLYQNREASEDGLLHDAMITAFSEELGISVEDLEARIAEGESLADIALSTGMKIEDFRTLLNAIRTEVHDQAVEDGLLPGTQSGWVNSRRAAMGTFGSRQAAGQGLRGTGQGRYGTGDCLID